MARAPMGKAAGSIKKPPIDEFFDAVHGKSPGLKQQLAKSLKGPKVTVKPAPVINKRLARQGLPPKPTAAQTRKAFEQTSVSPQARRRLQQAEIARGGYVDRKGKLHPAPLPPIAANNLSLEGLTSRVLGGIGLTGSQLGEAAVSIPSGVYHGLGAFAGDVKAGDVTFPRTRRVGEEVGKSFYYDVTHPSERPGFYLADVLSALSAGAGAVSKAGAFARGAGEAEGTALSRAAAGIREARKPHFGKLTSGKKSVDIPLSGNALVRPFQRSRLAAQQAKLDTGETHLFGRPVTGRGARTLDYLGHKPILKEFTAESRYGRALRSTHRIANDIGFAPGTELARHLTWATRRVRQGGKTVWRTDPARETSLALVGIFGNEALRNPATVVSRFVATHSRIVHDLTGRIDNAKSRGLKASGVRQLQRQIAAQVDLIHAARGAQRILEANPVEFQNALHAVRSLSGQAETLKIGAEKLTPEQAAGRLGKIHEFYGMPGEAPEGSFYFPTHSRYALGTKATPGKAAGRAPTQYGIGPPALVGQGKAWTGRSLEHGIPAVTHGVMEHFNRTVRFTSALHTFEDLYQAGSRIKHSVDAIPVRDTKTISRDLRAALQDASVWLEQHPEADGQLPARFMDKIKDIVVPKGQVPGKLGEATPGVRWIDPRYLKDTVGGGKAPGIMQAFDAINNVARVGQLYLRPGYLWNAPQNALMATFTQGVLAPWNIYQGVKSVRLYGPKVDALVRSMVGESRSQAYDYAGGTGRLARTSHRLAAGWNVVTDLWFRRASVYYNASKMGYAGKAGLGRLAKQDEHGNYIHQADIQKISQAAQKDSVDFNSMTPVERDYVRRMIYFYPWVSRGSAWTVRAAFEHPIKANVALHVGDMGRKHNPVWNFLPQWARDSGIFGIGDQSGANVLTINPAAMNTPATLVQTARVVSDLVGIITGKKPTGDFTKSLVPALESLVGGTTTGGIPGLAENMPVWKLLIRLGVPLPGQPWSRTYPKPGSPVWGALGPYSGAIFPRLTSKQGMMAQKKREQGKHKRGPAPTAKQLRGGGTLTGGTLSGGTLRGGTLTGR